MYKRQDFAAGFFCVRNDGRRYVWRFFKKEFAVEFLADTNSNRRKGYKTDWILIVVFHAAKLTNFHNSKSGSTCRYQAMIIV